MLAPCVLCPGNRFAGSKPASQPIPARSLSFPQWPGKALAFHPGHTDPSHHLTLFPLEPLAPGNSFDCALQLQRVAGITESSCFACLTRERGHRWERGPPQGNRGLHTRTPSLGLGQHPPQQTAVPAPCSAPRGRVCGCMHSRQCLTHRPAQGPRPQEAEPESRPWVPARLTW